ncbi:MAG: hypothetical protein NTW21_35225 [Verrucomicrobia bacterium]|nr:hypothetical protein [Verrucomicrobiota bacterium]
MKFRRTQRHCRPSALLRTRPDFAQSLYQRFDREGIPLLLAGGWAVSFHGYSRYTRDVDWIGWTCECC